MAKIKKFASADEYINYANFLYSQKRIKQAIRHLKQALVIDSKNIMAWNNLGAIYFSMKRNQEALDAYEKALKIDPSYSGTLSNIGMLYKSQGNDAQATFHIKKAIHFNPSLAIAHAVLGQLLTNSEKYEEAIREYRLAVGLNPALPELHNQLGNVYRIIDSFDKAIESYKISLALNPLSTQVWANLAAAFQFSGNLNETTKCLQKALEINKNAINLHYLLADILERRNMVDEAIKVLEKAIIINPRQVQFYELLYEIKRKRCDWKDLSKIEDKLDEIGSKSPFISVLYSENPEKNLVSAKAWCKDLQVSLPKVRLNLPENHHKKLRLGYVSRDFRDHPVGHMVANMFGYHGRKLFEVWAFSLGPDDKSIYRKMAEKSADKFIDCAQMKSPQIANVISQSGIDILIDLGGHTQDNHLEIFAFRPSPIQVTWLGFPGTIGADFIDYLIADKIIIPEENKAFFTEKIIYLPHCYEINNNLEKIADVKYEREDFGLPKEGFIFASFNQNQKVEPVMWKVWMNILKRVPNSTLWLWEQDKEATKNLKFAAKKLGINPLRINFSEKLSVDKHLARMKLADLALDTRIYGGHTTTSDMLWAGVPVVTKIGNHFASRVCASVLTEAGIPELVTKSLEEYEERAVYLAKNPNELKEIRGKITHENLLKNLYNTERFVKSLEKAFAKIYYEKKI